MSEHIDMRDTYIYLAKMRIEMNQATLGVICNYEDRIEIQDRIERDQQRLKELTNGTD